ncbi:MAG TPA: hypothetical protein DD473_06770 [Planctomycetaceae bacterium]|nr:hypothetical protein [Planctomycetaceae bacterium]
MLAIWRETCRIAIVTFQHFRHWATLAWIEAQHRFCLMRLNRQKVHVGEQMHDDRVGDEDLRKQVSELDVFIEQAKADKNPTGPATRSRRTLIIQLAETAPMSSSGIMTAEMKKAQSLRRTLADIEETRLHHWKTPSSTYDDWSRLGAGYGIIMLLFVFAYGGMMSGSSSDTMAKNKQSEDLLEEASDASVSGTRSDTDEFDSEQSQITDKRVTDSTDEEDRTSDDSVTETHNMLTTADPPRPLTAYDDPESNSVHYTPSVISRFHGQNHIVATEKMLLDNGLYLTLSFVVIDPDDPNAGMLDGVAGVAMLENLVTIHNHNLTRRTRLRIVRGALPAFEVESPQEHWVNDRLKALDYDGYSPLNLLYYLRGDGLIAIEVDGTWYSLKAMWRKHLADTLEETLVQRRAMGY